MAFILVQHPDPGHEGLLVELLAGRTAMTVLQAADGMPVEPEHLYVVPPGSHPSVGGGLLHLSPPAAHGARLPFDALLPSLAGAYGARAACVVLSGAGSDGSAGLRAVKDAGGLVLAQDPAEAGHGGMPRSAIATGLVDEVAPVAGLAGALAGHGRTAPSLAGGPAPRAPAPEAPDPVPDTVLEIVGLLRARARHDLAPCGRGTLERRIGRRMAMAPLGGGTDGARAGNGAGRAGHDLASYLALLRGDAAELDLLAQDLLAQDLLAQDLLIPVTGCFRDPAAGAPRVAELEASVRSLEASSEEQRAINEELLASKGRLRSLNEELQALNSRLQGTLERQRAASNGLRNILCSTDMATLFLDRALTVRFFTPATQALFSVTPGDIGRPLADLRPLAADASLPGDARAVLATLEPVEREVETPGGTWLRRRVLPCRADGPGSKGAGPGSDGPGSGGRGGGAAGVVVTYTDVTRRRQAAAALEGAKRAAETAGLAKSRLLAAASHGLRQPLQTLALLQGLLARAVTGDKAAGLVRRLDETLGALSGMLDTLLDLSQAEAGVVRAEVSDVRADELLSRLRDEFAPHARAKGVALRVVPCGATLRTDPRLLGQMLRTLLSDALTRTERGRVLLGCRRLGGTLRVEVWDTGTGIPGHEPPAAFQDRRQAGDEARGRGLGLGLGLSVVHRLGDLLGHPVHVRSKPGKGPVFTIETPRVADTSPDLGATQAAAIRTRGILVIEDDPDLRELLRLLLEGDGHQVTLAPDGPAALDMAAQGAPRPDLVLANLNLPGEMDGLQTAAKLRETVPGVPVIVLSGDVPTAALQAVASGGVLHLSKPVRPDDLLRMIQDLLTAAPGMTAPAGLPAGHGAPVVFVVDDDDGIRAAFRAVLEQQGWAVEDFASGTAFLDALQAGGEGCLLVDAAMPEMDGFEVLRRLDEAGHRLPAIMITGHGDVPTAVRAMKAGAVDFIEKPVSVQDLVAGVGGALDRSRAAGKESAWHLAAATRIAGLTGRQREVMTMVLAGHPNKNIAADLGISKRTVDNHRAAIMRKTGARSLPALARLAMAAALPGGPGTSLPAEVRSGQ